MPCFFIILVDILDAEWYNNCINMPLFTGEGARFLWKPKKQLITFMPKGKNSLLFD